MNHLECAVRQWPKNSGFTVVAVLTLALGIVNHFVKLSTSAVAQEVQGSADTQPLSAAAESMPPIGIVDVYGVRHGSEPGIREALQIKEGDAVPVKRGEAEKRVAAISGVVQVHLTSVCCDDGKSILYVGIKESDAPRIDFHAAPTGSVRLPDEIVQAGKAFERALMEAVQRGDAEEDQSQGHSLARNPAARAIQERFILFAKRDLDLLRDVLRQSSDAEHRVRAAEVMAYATNKQVVVNDLIHATRDPSPGVRNEAVRALALIAAYSHLNPELQLRVPWAPFIDLLNSVIWSDRNKASFALMQLSESRDPTLLNELKANALAALLEMTRWKSRGHAMPSFVILGRIAGMKDEAIFKAWDEGKRQSVIDLFREVNP